MAQLGRGVLIGQSACRLLTLAREAIDSTRASGRLHSAATGAHGGITGRRREATGRLFGRCRVLRVVLIVEMGW